MSAPWRTSVFLMEQQSVCEDRIYFYFRFLWMGLVTFALWGKQASRAQIRNCASNIDNENRGSRRIRYWLVKGITPKRTTWTC